MEKWFATSIRRAGLCADHFNENSFNGEGKKRLKRGSVPLPFRNIALPFKNNEDADIDDMPMTIEMIEIENALGNEMGTKKKDENAMRPTTLANVEKDKNNAITEQLFQWPPLKTYRSSQLDFNMISEEDDDMEWIHVEPPINEKISAQQIENEKSDAQIINTLKSENLRLHRTVRTLKLRLQKYIRRMPVKHTNKKSKKKVIQELMDEKKLHPVAKAMINLQLHTPHAPYTEEEKNLSKQLYYYSASALRGLRKAGCNFPGERSIRRWQEEYNMMPGFCEFIFHKLQEKISKIPAEERVRVLK